MHETAYNKGTARFIQKILTFSDFCPRQLLIINYSNNVWSRIARERRLCVCGHIQSEEHVLLHCTETSTLRQDIQY